MTRHPALQIRRLALELDEPRLSLVAQLLHAISRRHIQAESAGGHQRRAADQPREITNQRMKEGIHDDQLTGSIRLTRGCHFR